MEDFPLLVLFFIIYLIAGSSRKKKSKAKSKRGPIRTSAQGEQLDMRALMRDLQTKKGFQSAFSEKKEPDEQPCDQRRIHLHDVTNEQMLFAGEGEDPCHAGGNPAEPEHERETPVGEENRELAQDVLRGVIMSEILTRPCDRMAVRKGRNHGY